MLGQFYFLEPCVSLCSGQVLMDSRIGTILVSEGGFLELVG